MTRDLAERLRPSVTVVLHPNTRRIGALARAGDLDKAALLASMRREGER